MNDNYDEAFIVTQDSDMVPAIEIVRSLPQKRKVKLIGTPDRPHSKELAQNCDALKKIKTIHLERSLLPQQVVNASGNVVANRPAPYAPPANP